MVLVLEMDLGLGVEVGIEVVWVVINAKFPILLDPAIRMTMKRCLIPRYYFPPYILPLLTISIMNLYEFLSFIYFHPYFLFHFTSIPDFNFTSTFSISLRPFNYPPLVCGVHTVSRL